MPDFVSAYRLNQDIFKSALQNVFKFLSEDISGYFVSGLQVALRDFSVSAERYDDRTRNSRAAQSIAK